MNTGVYKAFNRRAFASLALAFSGVGLVITGLSLVGPYRQGPEAHALHSWVHVHLAYAALFVGFAIWHIGMNWRILVKYVKSARTGIPSVSREAIWAAAVFTVLTLLVALHHE